MLANQTPIVHTTPINAIPHTTSRARDAVSNDTQCTPRKKIARRFSAMRSVRNLLLVSLFFALSLPLFAQAEGDAQQPAAQGSEQAQPSNNQDQPQDAPPADTSTRPNHQTPCWRVAGISPEMVNQRWKIEDDAKTKISGVCNDPPLGPDQKHSKINEIKAQADEAITRLIPSSQLSAFRQCQAERKNDKPSRRSRTPQKELGPCGGVIPSSSSMGSHDQQMK